MTRPIGYLILMLAFVASLWTFTQLAAPQIDRRTRGNALVVIKGYHIYQPHQGAMWLIRSNLDIQERLRRPMLIGGSVFMGLFVISALMVKVAPKRDVGLYVSGARWATTDEIRKAGLYG